MSLSATFLTGADLVAVAQASVALWRASGMLPVLTAAEAGSRGVSLGGKNAFYPEELQKATPALCEEAVRRCVSSWSVARPLDRD